MFDLDNCVAFVTNIAAKTLSESLNSGLIEHGVTKTQWIAMYFIDREEDLTQKELAYLMGTKEPTVTGILDRLERDNLIERKEDKSDKRRKTLNLTSEGKEKIIQLTDIAQDFKDNCLEGISDKDQEIFLEVLDKMVKASIEWQENK